METKGVGRISAGQQGYPSPKTTPLTAQSTVQCGLQLPGEGGPGGGAGERGSRRTQGRQLVLFQLSH